MEVFPFITLRMAPSMFCKVDQCVYFFANQQKQFCITKIFDSGTSKKGYLWNIKRCPKACCLGDLTNSYASLLQKLPKIVADLFLISMCMFT